MYGKVSQKQNHPTVSSMDTLLDGLENRRNYRFFFLAAGFFLAVFLTTFFFFLAGILLTSFRVKDLKIFTLLKV